MQGVFAVQGWLKIESYTRPRENIIGYDSVWIGAGVDWVSWAVSKWNHIGGAILLKLVGIDDRDAAVGLVGKMVSVSRAELPPEREEEYYWSDLIGMTVNDRAGVTLGQVTNLLETGSHDVLVVGTDTLIPFVRNVYIHKVDRAQGLILVDWPK